MKKLTNVLTALVLALLASCTKSEDITPSVQEVTYTLHCKDCIIYLTDSKWNDGNELERSKHQYFNVSGDFSYTFINKGNIETARAEVSVSVLYPVQQEVTLSIRDNQGRTVTVVDTLGFSSNPSQRDRFTLTAKLGLK